MILRSAFLPLGAVLALSAFGCSSEPANLRTGDAAVTDSVLPDAAPSGTLRIDTIARDLTIPWGLVELPDGRLLVTERGGRIRIIATDGSLSSPLATLEVHAEDPEWNPESGLMGITLDPQFETSGHVFTLSTHRRVPTPSEPGVLARLRNRFGLAGADLADFLPFENRITRFTLDSSGLHSPTVIARGMWTNHYHAGGAIAFGPDGLLYATVGDGRRPALAQTDAHVGKLFRFTASGGVPADNPDPASPVYATGLRNTQGLAWLADGTLLGIDHGPSGVDEGLDIRGRDEINVLRRGANYGWPAAFGWEGAEGFTRPIWVWQRSVAPAALIAYTGAHEPWRGSIFVGRLRGGVERFTLEAGADGPRIAAHEVLALPDLGRVRTVYAGRDGALYVTTSNRDVRGTARPGDDLVLRIRPVPPDERPNRGSARVR